MLKVVTAAYFICIINLISKAETNSKFNDETLTFNVDLFLERNDKSSNYAKGRNDAE